jgi:hypothetical protein
LYLLLSADLPTDTNVSIATIANDTAAFAIPRDPSIPSKYHEVNLNIIHNWLIFWPISVNENKSVYVTFTTRTATCPAVYLNGTQIAQAKDVKYFVMHLDK